MNSNSKFTPGLELARRFYWEAVRPVLDAKFPDLRHSAALIGLTAPPEHELFLLDQPQQEAA